MSLFKEVRDYGIEGLEHNVITAPLEKLINWSLSLIHI